jgi:hypothetical protein
MNQDNPPAEVELRYVVWLNGVPLLFPRTTTAKTFNEDFRKIRVAMGRPARLDPYDSVEVHRMRMAPINPFWNMSGEDE